MKTLVLSLLLLSGPVLADSWQGRDKDLHAITGAAFGAAVTLALKSPAYGCAAATGAGLAKEIYDSQNKHRHTASFKDFAVTAVAGCAAAKLAGFAIVPRQNGVLVSYKLEF